MKENNQSTNNLIKWLPSIILWATILIVNTISAQPCNMLSNNITDYPAVSYLGGAGEIILPAVRVGVTTSFTIPINVTDYTVSTSTEEGSCTEIFNNYTLNTAGNIIEVTINKRCPLGMENYLSFVYTVSKTGCSPESKTFQIPVIRDSAKIVLTLDISGSMNSNVVGSSQKRIDALKTAVNAFIPKLEEFQKEGDSLGLTYFSSMVYQPSSSNFNKEFIKITNNDEPVAANYASYKVFNDLSARSPMQMTAMGSGLIDAKNKLLKYNTHGSNTKKMVFLFTDGLQNYGPLVNTDGNSLNNGTDSLNNKSLTTRDSVKYFTIATWEAGMAPEILNTIATKSGGQAIHVIGGTPTLNDWFNTNLYNLLNEGSPQIVFVKKCENLLARASFDFNINENIDKMLVELFSANDDSIVLNLRKGKQVIRPNKIINGNGYKIFTYHFPKSSPKGKITSGGDWFIDLSGRSSKPYTITAFVDDHLLKYNCTLNKPIYTVGDTLQISARLSYAGKPVNESCKVKAIILKPGNDVGHMLATYPTPKWKSNLDIKSAANLKFQTLMENDSSFIKSLQSKEHIVELENLGDGVFRGQFTNTELTGIYNIVFVINSELKGIGKIERTTTLSTVFKFGNVEPQDPKIDIIPKSGGRKNLVINIMPKNKYGYLMGPGFVPTQSNGTTLKSGIKHPSFEIGSAIKVEILSPKNKGKDLKSNKNEQFNNEIYIEEINDNLDGSYSIVVANVPENTNPDVNISVKDEPLYKGKIWPVPIWIYIIVIISIVLLLLSRYVKLISNKPIRILLLLITIGLLVTIYLQNSGIITFLS